MGDNHGVVTWESLGHHVDGRFLGGGGGKRTNVERGFRFRLDSTPPHSRPPFLEPVYNPLTFEPPEQRFRSSTPLFLLPSDALLLSSVPTLSPLRFLHLLTR